jgi:hypothetical protein
MKPHHKLRCLVVPQFELLTISLPRDAILGRSRFSGGAKSLP